MNSILIFIAGCLAVTVSGLPFVSKEKAGCFEETTCVDFYLYTASNPIQGQRIFATTLSIFASDYDSDYATRIVIHDYTQDYLSPGIKRIRNAWLSVGQYNVILVDWPIAINRLTTNPALAVPEVGAKLAKLIDLLVEDHFMSLETTQVIGYGLGAHVAGYAGKNVKSGLIGTIVGLDPSLPSFSYDEPSNRLNNTDALYVETIQTAIKGMGYEKPIGRASFYPNGGTSQPGCDDFHCDHRRSLDYYFESIILNNFATVKCNSHEDAIAQNCGDVLNSVRMGGDKLGSEVTGIFYVPVNQAPPYGILL